MSQTIKMMVETALFVAGLACLVWLTVRSLKRSDDPAKIIFKWGFTIPFVIFCIWLAQLLGPFGPFLIVFMGISPVDHVDAAYQRMVFQATVEPV